jgi:solute carrier family 50 protein (sugar transporter)
MSFVINFLCPLLGVILANIMWLSSLKSVLSCRRSRTLGKVNPLPYAIIVHNCIGWVAYGILKLDYFIFFANAPGLVLGLYYCVTCLSVLNIDNNSEQYRTFHDVLERIVFIGIVAWLLVFSIVCMDNAQNPPVPIIGYIGLRILYSVH